MHDFINIYKLCFRLDVVKPRERTRMSNFAVRSESSWGNNFIIKIKTIPRKRREREKWKPI